MLPFLDVFVLEGRMALLDIACAVITLSDADSLLSELTYLREIFFKNGFESAEIHLMINRALPVNQVRGMVFGRKKKNMLMLPYCRLVYSQLGWMASWFGFQPIYQPLRKLGTWFHRVKDNLELRPPGIYKNPCGCGRVYIGERGRTAIEQIMEHASYILLNQAEKSALAKHCVVRQYQPFFLVILLWLLN